MVKDNGELKDDGKLRPYILNPILVALRNYTKNTNYL